MYSLTYTYTLHANQTLTNNLNLLFNLGASSEDVWIDNVFFGENCSPYEICDNGLDDDGDGLVDCDDPDCSLLSNGGIEELTTSSFTSVLEGNPAEKLLNNNSIPEWTAGLAGNCMYYVNDVGSFVNNPEGDFFVWLPGQWDCFVNDVYFTNAGMVDGQDYTISFHAASWDISLDGSCNPDGGMALQTSGMVNVEIENQHSNSTVIGNYVVPQSTTWANLNWQKYSHTFTYDAATQLKFALTNATNTGLAIDGVILSKTDCVPSLTPEICDNGIDDDGDGLIDNNDGDCGCTSPNLTGSINPLALTDGFQILSEGDFKLSNDPHIHGPLGVGGDLIVDAQWQAEVNMDPVGSYIFPGDGSTSTGLLVNGRVNWVSGFVGVKNNKYIHVGNNTGCIESDNGVNMGTQILPSGTSYNNTPRIETTIDQTPNPAVFQNGDLDFSCIFNSFRVYSEGMANCTENVQLYMSNNNPILNNELTYTQDVKITSLATGTNYLNLTTAALSNVGSLIFEGNGTPTATKPLIINVVLTSDYVWNNSNMNGISNAAAQYIIWNFSGTNTHTLTINTAAQIKGSVFAPNHDLIKLGTGDIEGGIIAKTIDIGIGEIHYYQFASSIDLCGSTNEICNNGIDDDGDSLIDEDCPTNNNCPNDLTNNEFDNGTTDWWMYAQDGNTATHTVDNANQLSGINSSKIAISTASGTDWHIQLGQSGKHIEVGKIYEVSFEAKAAANKTITVLLELDAAPWTGYFKRVVNLTSTPTTYTFTYHANHTITGNLNLLFNLAGNSEDVWIDNVFFGETCATYEICDNGIDDDGDGLVDCDDPDCSIISNGGIEEQGYNFSYASNLEGSPAERLVNGEAMPEWVAGLSGTCMYYVNDTGETVNNPEGDFFIWLPTAGDCFVNTTYFSDLGMVDGNQYTISFHAASWDISLDGSCYPDGGTTTQGQGLINVETEDFSNNSVVLASLSVPQSNSWTNLNWQKYKYTFIYDAANQSKFVLTNGTTRGIALDNVILSKADCVPSILEICDNGIDDDGDTDVDCADSDCQSLNLTNPTVSACINQPLRDVATVSVQVSWTNGPSGDDIEVSLGDKTETIFVSSGATSPQTIEFITIADGSTNNTISAIWKNNTTYCNPTTTFDAPVACSNDALACNILYLCGLDKPYDGDSWDHGFIEYVDALNGAQTVTPILTKADGSGMGTYDVMNQNTFVNVTLRNAEKINLQN